MNFKVVAAFLFAYNFEADLIRIVGFSAQLFYASDPQVSILPICHRLNSLTAILKQKLIRNPCREHLHLTS